MDIAANIAAVRARIATAAARAGRAAAEVRLIAVSKTKPPELVRAAVAEGVRDIGESYVQEALAKRAAVGGDVCWHLIGHLQRNKVARALELFDVIHSIDSIALGEAVARQAAARGMRVRVLVEVNVGGEASKHGVAPDRLEELISRMRGLPGLALDGLMTIGHPVERADQARADFVRLRTLRDRVERATGAALPHLSMGMSADFEVAIEEGATFVRVGTALFGARVSHGA